MALLAPSTVRPFRGRGAASAAAAVSASGRNDLATGPAALAPVVLRGGRSTLGRGNARHGWWQLCQEERPEEHGKARR